MSVHLDRPVRIDVAGGRAVVHKEYLVADAAEVHASMTALWASPFGARRRPPGMPEPLACDGRTITMGFVAGEPVGRRGDLGASLSLAVPCARLLADLHASGVSVPRRRGPARLAASLHRKSARFVAAHPALATPWYDALHALDARVASSGAATHVLCHGDLSPRNVLDADDGPVLIDFDRLQLAHPSRDVEYWRSWVWVTELLAGAMPSWSRTTEFVAAYADSAPRELGDAIVEPGAVALHRCAALLRIAEGWSALRDAPEVAALVVREASVAVSPA